MHLPLSVAPAGQRQHYHRPQLSSSDVQAAAGGWVPPLHQPGVTSKPHVNGGAANHVAATSSSVGPWGMQASTVQDPCWAVGAAQAFAKTCQPEQQQGLPACLESGTGSGGSMSSQYHHYHHQHQQQQQQQQQQQHDSFMYHAPPSLQQAWKQIMMYAQVRQLASFLCVVPLLWLSRFQPLALEWAKALTTFIAGNGQSNQKCCLSHKILACLLAQTG